MNWLYKEKEIKELSDIPEGSYGFVYRITQLSTGRYYIGKKKLFSSQKKKLGKKEVDTLLDKRKKHWKTVIKEGDWKTYYGSNETIKNLIKEGKQEDFKREILIFTDSEKLLTYYETKYLFCEGVIEPESTYYNDNILSKFFRKDFLR